jgi:hypothetical protein
LSRHRGTSRSMPSDGDNWGGDPYKAPRDEKGVPDEPGGGDTADGYDVAPLPPEARDEELAEKVHKRKRGKRSRSVLKADEVPHPFTIRQGWLDSLFETTMLPIMVGVAFFFGPLLLPVVIFGAIIAHDNECRKNAFILIGFCFLPVLLMGCLFCMVKAMGQ